MKSLIGSVQYAIAFCQVYKSKLVLTYIICHSNIFLSLFFVLTQGLLQSGLVPTLIFCFTLKVNI